MSVTQTIDIEAELKKILSQAAEAKGVKNYEVKPNIIPQVGDGFMSKFYKGEILNKDTGEKIFVGIKMAPSYVEIDFLKPYINEEVFYTSLLPAMQCLQDVANIEEPFNNTPTYLASSTGSINFIALENVSEKGYGLHDKKAYLSRECLEKIFNIYGKFHALSFVLRRYNRELYNQIHNKLAGDLFSYFVKSEKDGQILVNGITAAAKSLDHDSQVYKDLKELPSIVVKLYLKIACYKGEFRCLTHGDCWSNNMLFKYSDNGKLEDIKLIDFQLARDGTPIHDLAYFFYSGAAKEDLYRINKYLKIYHDSFSRTVRALGKNPEELFPFQTLLNEWKENALFGVLLAIHLWQIKLLPKAEYQDYLKDATDDKKLSVEDLNKIFLDLMKKIIDGNEFKERVRSILEQAFDTGVISKEKVTIDDTL